MTTLQDRFNSKVRITPGCWHWTGALSGLRYGGLKHEGKVLKAHRLSFELAHGPVPDGMQVLHRCDRPTCVNPDHLWLGTHLDNMRDMFAKKRRRAPLGELNGRAKLTAEQAAAIRADSRSVAELSKAFGVSKVQIYNIRKSVSWASA